jgi:hypothetical protein
MSRAAYKPKVLLSLMFANCLIDPGLSTLPGIEDKSDRSSREDNGGEEASRTRLYSLLFSVGFGGVRDADIVSCAS